jgi:hypothetical protein
MEFKKRLNLGSLMRKRSCESRAGVQNCAVADSAQAQDVHVDPNADNPESNAARGVVGRHTGSGLGHG